MVLWRGVGVWLLPFLQGVRAVDHDENDQVTVLTTSITVPSGSAAVVDFTAIGIGGSSPGGSSTPTTSFTSTALHSGYHKENLTTSITIPPGSIPVVHFTPISPRKSYSTPRSGASGSTRGGARTRTLKQSAGSSTPASTITSPRLSTKSGKSSSHKSSASETGSAARLSIDTTSSSSSTRGAHTITSGPSSGKASATGGSKSSVSGGSTASSSQSATGGDSSTGTDTSASTDSTDNSRSSTSTNGAHHHSDPSGAPRSSSKLSTGTSTGTLTGSSTGTSTGSITSGTGTSSSGSTTASQPTVSTTWSSAEDIFAVSGSLTGSSSEWLAAIVEYEPTGTPSEVAWGTLTAAPTATTSGAASDQGIILAGRWKLLWDNRNDIKDKTSRKKYKGELNELLDDTSQYSETNDIDTSKSGCSGSLKKRSLFSDIGSTLSTAENAVKDIGSSAASKAASIASGALGGVLGCISEVGKEIDANLPDDVEDLPDDKIKTVEDLTDDMVDLTDFWQSVEEQVEKKEEDDNTSQSDSSQSDSQSSTKSNTESSSATSSSSKSSSGSSCSSVTFTDCFDDEILGTKSIILTNNVTSVTHWSTVTTTCFATSGCFSTPTTIQSTTKVACVAREVPLTSGASRAATASTGTASKTSTSTASSSSDPSSSGSDSTTSTTSSASTSSADTSSTSTKSTSTTSSASASPTAEIYIAFSDETLDPEWKAFVVKSGDADENPNLCNATPASSWEASGDIKIGDLPFPPKHTFSVKSELPGCVYAPGDDSAGTFACVNLATTCTTDFKGYAKERVCGNTPMAAKVLCQLSSSDESYDG